jgi:filamentous hemagglutinin
VQEQSGLVAENKVDVTVGGNTDLKAGIIVSKSKDLSLDTGTLTFSDLADKDKSTNIGGLISVGGPLSSGGDKNQGKGNNSGDLNFTSEGQYALREKEGVTRATVGKGSFTSYSSTGDRSFL